MFRLFVNGVFYAVVGWICYLRGLDFGTVGGGGWGLRIGCEWRGEEGGGEVEEKGLC